MPTVGLSGYRLFSHSNELKLPLGERSVAILGENRSGKAAALKWMYDLRPALLAAASADAEVTGSRITWPASYRGPADVFSVADPSFRIDLTISSGFSPGDQQVRVAISPEGMHQAQVTVYPTQAALGGTDALAALSSARFYGAFRSALNVDADIAYFDLNASRPFRVRPDLNCLQTACDLTGDLFRTSITTTRQGDDLSRITVGNRSFELPIQSSGLTQFLAVIYHALIDHPSYILIEEPELHLDEPRRRAFVRLMARLAGIGLIFCTHDHALADSEASSIVQIK
jgi:hypothetical protein